MSFLLALDAGTTSLKGALFDLSGKVVGICVHEYHLDNPAPDIVELEAEVYWSAAQAVIAELLQATAVPPAAITALGVTSQKEFILEIAFDVPVEEFIQ